MSGSLAIAQRPFPLVFSLTKREPHSLRRAKLGPIQVWSLGDAVGFGRGSGGGSKIEDDDGPTRERFGSVTRPTQDRRNVLGFEGAEARPTQALFSHVRPALHGKTPPQADRTLALQGFEECQGKDQVLQFLLSGVAIGAIYGLIGMALAITFYVTRIINFAQGQMMMATIMVTAPNYRRRDIRHGSPQW